MLTPATGGAQASETHSAWVLLIGDRAYKLKKPVRLPFLDFSTRAARQAVLHRELELNRRLAPDVYLGVVDATAPDGEPCDHVLVMRRMPDDRRLSTLVEQRVPLRDEIREIARVVAAFHARSETSDAVARAGAPETVRSKITADLGELADLAGGPSGEILDPDVLEGIGVLARRYLDGRAPLLEARIAGGHVRDGHGDLLAADVFCLADGPRILDCIEFDDRLRYGDVLADVAFLAMDLERLGAPELASAFVADYQEFSGTGQPASLVEYYTAFRALIRAKVAAIRFGQGDVSQRDDAATLLVLAHEHLRRGEVRLALVGGPPGTGKSTLALGVADHLGWTMLRSDEVRKDLVGIAHDERAAARLGEGIYDAVTTEATYREMLNRARTLLEHGESVVLDASWSQQQRRGEAAAVARDTASRLIELRCDVPAPVAEQRIADRAVSQGDPSDADPVVAAAMRAGFEAWPSAVEITTDRPRDATVAAALELLGPGWPSTRTTMTGREAARERE